MVIGNIPHSLQAFCKSQVLNAKAKLETNAISILRGKNSAALEFPEKHSGMLSSQIVVYC